MKRLAIVVLFLSACCPTTTGSGGADAGVADAPAPTIDAADLADAPGAPLPDASAPDATTCGHGNEPCCEPPAVECVDGPTLCINHICKPVSP